MTKAQRAIMVKYSIPEEFRLPLIELTLDMASLRFLVRSLAGPFARYRARIDYERAVEEEAYQRAEALHT